MRPYFALCQIPMPKDADNVLYNEVDGRELDERAECFAGSCVQALKEVGVYDLLSCQNILDVGCGRGVLLSMLPVHRFFAGYEGNMRVGVDPQPKAKEFAVDGVNIITGTMKDVHNKFDVVMSWHVIEHVDNPVEFIQDMVDHAFIGGLVIIATPNADSIKAKSHKWRCLEPFHKYLLGKKLLKQMMEDSGLCIVAEMTWGGFPAPRSWWQNIGNRVLKWIGQGDVQLIVARKSIDK